MSIKLVIAAAGGLMYCLSGVTHAALIGFDDIPNTANGIQTHVTSSGYDFNGGHFHIIDSSDPRLVRNASSSYLTAEAASDLGEPVTMTQVGGGTFTLNQVEIAELWLPGEPLSDFQSVLITANQFGGGTLSQLVTLDGIRDGAGGVADFQLVTFSGWVNLTDVTFTGVNAAEFFGDFSIDNIVVDSVAVPEPASLMLMGMGVVGFGVGATRRRRRN